MADILGSSLSGVFSNFSTSNMFVIAEYILLVVGLGALAWYVGRLLQFNIKVWVIEKRGQTDQVLGIDKARLMRNKDGILKVRLAKSKMTIDVPSLEYFHNIKWGGMFYTRVLVVEKYGEESYAPVKMDNIMQGFKFTPIENKVSNIRGIMEEIDAKYAMTGFWNKWGQLIIQMVMFGMLFLMLIFVMKGLDKTTAAFTSAANSFSSTEGKIVEACGESPSMYDSPPTGLLPDVTGLT